MMVSVVLPCRNEAAHIGRCLDSVLDTAWPPHRLEILVVDGRSEDGTDRIVARYAERDPRVRLLDNPKRVVPTAVNLGIQAARGDVIVRMDAHVLYPPDYIPRLIRALRESGADNVGGRVVTLPAGESPVARAIALALAHPFGVGNAWFRIGVSSPRWVDTVPFGCYRREIFDRVGLFDEELVRNQDDEFNHRLIRRGGRILLHPEVVSFYYARGSYRQLARMYFQYGYFKPLAARKVGRVSTFRQVVPALFVLALSGSAVGALLWPPARIGFGLVAGSYLLALLLAVLGPARRYGFRVALALLGAFPVLHIAYGVGFLGGLLDLVLRRRTRWTDPAAIPLSR